MQTKVRLNEMLRAVEEREEIKKKLDACESELAQIKRELSELSGMELPIERIQQCEEKVETESRYIVLFKNALSNISTLYEKNENKLVDYSENIRIAARRESFSNQDLKELSKVFYNILF